MLALQPPARNLFSTRVPRLSAPRNVADYLASLRGSAPPWGVEGSYSPQWHAANEIVEMRLYDKLADRLRVLTRLSALPADTPLDGVLEQYLADAGALGDQLDAINRLFATVADAQTQPSAVIKTPELSPYHPDFYFHQQEIVRAQAQVEKARARFAQSLFVPMSADEVLGAHVVTADLLAGAREVTLATCRVDIDRRCQAVAAYAVQCLFDGLESGLLGLVVWPAPDACWYVRSERIVELKGHWTQNTYAHWHVTKEVHLMDAEQLGGIPGWLDLPPAVERVAAAVPPLLHADLGTVVGTMVRERHISWLVGEVTYPAPRVQPQRKLIIDPAIVIGSVCLTGWETPEHRRPGWWMRLDRYLARRASRALATGQHE